MQFRLNILYINSIKCSELLLQKPKIKNQFRYIEQYHTNFYYSDSQSFSWTVFIRRINQLKIYIFGLSQTFSSTLQQFVNPVSFRPPPPLTTEIQQLNTVKCLLEDDQSMQSIARRQFTMRSGHYKIQQFISLCSDALQKVAIRYKTQQFNKFLSSLHIIAVQYQFQILQNTAIQQFITIQSVKLQCDTISSEHSILIYKAE